MHPRPKLTWLAFIVVALSAEGIAVAQPPTGPAPTAAPAAPTGTAPAPPRPAPGATSASKKGSADAVDWNRMASRQAAAASSSNAGPPLQGAGGPIPPGAAAGGSLQGLHGDAPVASPTTAGRATRVALDSVADPGAAPATADTPESVVRGQINPAARTCYESDPGSRARRPGRLVLLLKVDAAGTVKSVSVGINAGVGPSLVSCITDAARAAKFVAPGADGATVPASFTFPLRAQGS